MRYVLLYEPAANLVEKAPAHFPAHLARLSEFHTRGELLSVGTFEDPQRNGSMSIFTNRAAAEAFVRDDPFMVHGVMRAYRILEWDEMTWHGTASDTPDQPVTIS